jgi:hypothetical protein
MAGKPGMRSDLPTTLPAKYTAGFPWQLSRRVKTAREIAADLFALWQDLGGADDLSSQERTLCERAVYLRRRVLEHESAVMRGDKPLMTEGEHANACNTLMGILKALGLHRRARPVRSLHEHMAGGS